MLGWVVQLLLFFQYWSQADKQIYLSTQFGCADFTPPLGLAFIADLDSKFLVLAGRKNIHAGSYFEYRQIRRIFYNLQL